jgi:hypothetical protein
MRILGDVPIDPGRSSPTGVPRGARSRRPLEVARMGFSVQSNVASTIRESAIRIGEPHAWRRMHVVSAVAAAAATC